MCTLVLLRRPDARWPLILGANRDEMQDRASLPPGRHWPDRPDIVAGQDLTAQGSWLGLNDHGVVAAVLNRVGTLGPQAGKRSRGDLVLEALDHPDAAAAATALAALETRSYRPFNLVVADNRDAYWLAHRGQDRVALTPIPPGLSMLTARELDDMDSPRIRRYHARFAAARPPDPESDEWREWQALLDDREPDPALGAESAMHFRLPVGFGTVSSSLLALAEPGAEPRARWRFAGHAGQISPWAPVDLG